MRAQAERDGASAPSRARAALWTAHGQPRCQSVRDGVQCALPGGHWQRLRLVHEYLSGFVIRLVHPALPGTAADSLIGAFLVSYDPDVRDGIGQFFLTRDVREARRFESEAEARAEYERQSEVRPLRVSDGKPNRPLTQWDVEVLDVVDAIEGKTT